MPSLSRVIFDYDRVLRDSGAMYKSGGRMVSELANQSDNCSHVEGRETSGWEGVRLNNLLEVVVVFWLYFQALEVKVESKVELIKSMATARTVGEINILSHEEEDTDVNNDVV